MTLSRFRFTVLSVLGALLTLGSGLMMVYFSLDIFATGSYSHRGTVFSASRHPVSFWAAVAVGWVFGVVAIAAAPLMAWRAWKATAQEQREIEHRSPMLYGPTRRWLIFALGTLVILCVLAIGSSSLAGISKS